MGNLGNLGHQVALGNLHCFGALAAQYVSVCDHISSLIHLFNVLPDLST